MPADIEAVFRSNFGTFRSLRAHPLAFIFQIEMSTLDRESRFACRTFPDPARSFPVIGPAAQARTYHQPARWTRCGLKVMGKYRDDAWL